MKFTLSWLKTYLETDLTIHEIAKSMTMIGLEVEEVMDSSAKLEVFTVAKVISAAKHPNADKLQVLQVETVDGLKEIVCGAPNARAGMTSIYAPIGAYVPGLDVTLVEKPVRGVVSNGMMCSASELMLSDESDGILDLEDSYQVGQKAVDLFGQEAVIDFEVTPNRPDWLGVYGIARDLAAAGAGRLIERDIPSVTGRFACPITIDTDETLCPYFTGRVIRGVKNGPSPKWLQERLSSVGLKPISALVDITNFIALDRARPLHVYDVSKLSGSNIRAEKAGEIQDFKGLDSKLHTVSPEMIAIKDDSGLIGLGGVMGGETTGVDTDTTTVFLESALFDAVTIAQTGRETTIFSDAQYRFARGVDPEFTLEGLEMATALILDICGGEASEIVTAGAVPPSPAPVIFDPSMVEKLTGLKVSPEKTAEILTALGFGIDQTTTPWTVSIPSWRADVHGKADLVEEVSRISGFSEIPATPLPIIVPKNGGILTPKQARSRRARRFMAASGYQEAVTWSFMPNDKAIMFGGGTEALRLANPIAADLDTMRPSCVPNLLDALKFNAQNGRYGGKLFEIGPIYLGATPLDQRTTISALCAPSKTRHWQKVAEDTLFSLKSDLLRLLEELNVPVSSLQLVQGQNSPHWHPGRSARLQLGPKTVLAEFGELHPKILKNFALEGAYVGFELILELLPTPKAKATKSKGALTLSSLMPLSRDFSFLYPEKSQASDLIRAIKAADKNLIGEVAIFDLYSGANVPEGHISIGIEVFFTPTDKTLNDADIDGLMQAIIKNAEKTGAVLRV